MVSKVGSSRFDILGSGGVGALGGTLAVRTSSSAEAATASASDDAATISLNSGQKVSAPGVENYLSLRANAISAITSLRSEQQALAEKGATLAEGEELATLQTRFTEIEEEVQRISSEATYRGQNVLSAAAYGENDASDNINTKIISVSDASSLTTDPGLSLADPEQADAAYDALTILVGQTSTESESSARAQEVAASSTASSSDAPSEDASRISVEEARSKVRTLVDDVYSASSSGYSSTLDLIDSISGDSSE